MEKVRVMSMRLRVVAVALVAAISCVCVKADDSAGSGVTISGTVLTEPGGKPVKKAKVRVFWPEKDFVGLTKKVDKSGKFSVIASGCPAGTKLILQPIVKDEKPTGTMQELNCRIDSASNIQIIDELAETTLRRDYFVSHSDGLLSDAILSIVGVYGNNLNFYNNHKTVSIMIDGKRWISDMQKTIGREAFGTYSSLSDMSYPVVVNAKLNSKHSSISDDLNRDVKYSDVVRIDYLSSSQRIAVGAYTAPGGVLLITTKADPEMKWVDDLRLTMVEL